jgi:hypothetical protein
MFRIFVIFVIFGAVSRIVIRLAGIAPAQIAWQPRFPALLP